MLMRIITCPLPAICPLRDNPAERTTIKCEDFHKGPQPILRYKCAVCRTDELPFDLDLNDESTRAEIHLYPEYRRAFALMDLDYISEFQHLAKTRRSRRRYFVQADYRNEYMDEKDEHVAVRYLTGKAFIGEPDGRLVPVNEEMGREVRRHEDPSPELRDSNGQRDWDAEEAEACADELQSDELYSLYDDPEGGRTVV